jgi:cytoskeleton protein RodZ
VTEGIEQIVEEIPQPEVAEGQLHLLLTFTGDCWTEITDASGRRLLFMLGKDGRTVELSGVEPFNVLFGNPSNVTLRVNGEDYALPPTNRPDRPMRLTLSGS